MSKVIIILLGVFIPTTLIYGFVVSDFTINPQSTYAVPPGTLKVLILDLTLPEPIDSIKIKNEGDVQQYNLSRLQVYKDGQSLGWDGDEGVIFTKSSSPFWDDTFDLPAFSEKRIFVAIDIASTTVSGRTLKPKAVIGDIEITGFERKVVHDASIPAVPLTPLAGSGEVLSTTTIRWHFDDRSNNEFGFKILDENLNELARNETADISYIDETGLQPATEYSGRKIVAFNDMGESSLTSLSIFEAVWTLAPPETVEEVRPPAEVGPQPAEEEDIEIGPEAEEEPEEELTPAESLRTKIKELQTQLIELLQQLIQVLQGQLVKIGSFMASLWMVIF